MNDKLVHIDGMRGVAILLVILVHTAQSVIIKSNIISALAEYGQMGVQLFFIASAYTLCHSWSGREGEPNKVWNFAIRRYFRIAPLYYLALAMYWLVSVIQTFNKSGMYASSDQYSIQNIILNLLFLHGFYPPANNNIVPGGWSIATEMCFYVIFPVLMAINKEIKWNRGYQIFLLPFGGLIISQAAIYYASAAFEMDFYNNSFLYFNIVTQGPVFLVGIAFYFVNKENMWPARTMWGNFIGFGLFTALSMTLWHCPGGYAFSVIPVVSGVSFVFLTKFFELLPGANYKYICNIGRVSYSMYIFHFLFSHNLMRRIERKFQLDESIGDAATLIVYLLISIVLSYFAAKFSEKFIERRFIAIGNNIILKRLQRASII